MSTRILALVAFRNWCRSLGYPESQIQPPTCEGQIAT